MTYSHGFEWALQAKIIASSHPLLLSRPSQMTAEKKEPPDVAGTKGTGEQILNKSSSAGAHARD